jgi:acylphosphatase
MQLAHKNIIVSGIVQGVGFRYHTVRIARSMGIKGYVKNLPDGSVFIEAEAFDHQVEKFILWCSEGPSRASVNEVSVSDAQLKNFTGFDVR